MPQRHNGLAFNAFICSVSIIDIRFPAIKFDVIVSVDHYSSFIHGGLVFEFLESRDS